MSVFWGIANAATTEPSTGDPVAGGIAILFLLVLYMLPSIVAEWRKHPNTSAITILNIFLGWTFLFWVLALVWSVSHTEKRARA